METVFVGVDVSKDWLDVHLLPSEEAFSVERTSAGVAALAERLTGLSPGLVAMEATGGFETIVAAGLASAGLPLAVINPRQIRAFAQAVGKRAKTDPLDAQVIARFAQAVRPDPRPIADEEAQMLGELVARRRQLVEMMVAERNRRRSLTRPRLIKGVDRVLAALQHELTALEQDIDQTIRGSPVWREAEDCSPPSRAWATRPPAPCWPNSPNSAASTESRSPPWPAWPPTIETQAASKASAASPADAPRSAPPSTWPPSLHGDTTPCSSPSPNACAPPARPPNR